MNVIFLTFFPEWDDVSRSLISCAAFGILGVLLIALGFRLFDLILTKIDVEAEIAKGNIAAAILGGAVLLAISTIVAVAIH